jgi:hypothetical protein
MVAENGPYNDTCTIHDGYIPNRLHKSLKTTWSPPCCIYFNAESSNSKYLLCNQNVFGRTVNNKCLISETHILWEPAELLWRKESGYDDNKNMICKYLVLGQHLLYDSGNIAVIGCQ